MDRIADEKRVVVVEDSLAVEAVAGEAEEVVPVEAEE